MSTSKSKLNRIDLSADSRHVLAALIKLLTPHIPYSLHILGSILNTVPRASTLQNLDPSKVTLWSTIPFHHDPILITDPPALFSVVTFSQCDHQFRFFCSSDTRTDDPPTEVERTHVKQVLECLRDIAREAHPTYDSILTALGGQVRRSIDTDPPMIAIWAIHVKWADVLAPISCFQFPGMRYAYPPNTFEDSLPLAVGRWMTVRGGGGGDDDDSQAEKVEISQIRASDLPFVRDATNIPRMEAYVLSRAPYSVCLRSSRGETSGAAEEEGRQPIACVYMHSDGSIGALRVDSKYRRRGLGKWVVRALVEKLDLGKDRDDSNLDLTADVLRDLVGGRWGGIGRTSQQISKRVNVCSRPWVAVRRASVWFFGLSCPSVPISDRFLAVLATWQRPILAKRYAIRIVYST